MGKIVFKGEIMKKRLTCLVLCLVLLASVVLTGCGNKTDDEIKDKISEEASAEAMTLTMYLMSEAPVSADTEARVEAAINKITEDTFKTRIDLRIYTADEYYTKLDAAIAQRNEAIANKTYSATVSKTLSEGEKDALIRYPDAASYQVDIFYFGGQDRFDAYKNAGELANLSSSIENASKQLTATLASQYFKTLKELDKNIYAVPSNRAIGEYTYMLLNKQALGATYLSAESFTSLTDATCQSFLEQICESSTLREQYVPLYTNVDGLQDLIPSVNTIGVDANGAYADVFSIIGVDYTDGRYTGMSSVLNNSKFTEAWKTLKAYQLNGYYGTEEDVAAERDFAVGVVKGGAELVDIYGDDYEMIPLRKPALTTEFLYEHMMGVSQYTSNVERSMEIITYLNTNEEFRNLLQYGIEGKDYHLVDTEVKKNEFGDTYKAVQRSGSETYVLDPEKTGNVFLTYSLYSENLIHAIHEYGILQNKDVSTSWDLGFAMSYEGAEYVNREWMNEAQAISNEILAAYNAITSIDEFDAFLEAAKAKVAAATNLGKLLAPTADGGEAHLCAGACGSLKCYFSAK